MQHLRNHSAPCSLFALLLTLGIASYAHAQHWTQNVKGPEPTFQDIQQAFNDHWAPFDVRDGYYVDVDGQKHKAPGWKQFKRWEWYWQQRTGPSGQFPSNLVDCMEWEEIAKAKHRPSAGYDRGASDWTSLGPNSPDNIAGVGRVNCIAFHPTNANTYWIGTPAGGMWKTTNGGGSWTTNTDNLPVLGVSWIAIHPTTPNTMYIATGDGDAASSLSAFGQQFQGDTKSIGILRSTNGGNSWTSVLSAEQSEGLLIRKVLIDPAFPDYVYAATNFGIYQTTDAGATWANILQGYFMDLEFNPGNSDIVYAATYDPSGNAQVFTSTDYGQNWTQTTNLSGVNRIDIAVTPASPDNADLLCSDASNHGLHSLYWTSNSGASWSQYWTGGAGNNLLGWMGDASDANGQGSYDLTMAIDPANYSNIFVGGVNLWRTNDGGSSWSTSNIWSVHPDYNPPPNPQLVHADKHHVVFHPTQANTMFDCNDGGVYKSTNGGLTWMDISAGIVNSQLYSLSSSQTNSDLIVAGLQDNGSIGYDQGEWELITGGDGMKCHIDPIDPNYLYTSYANGKLYGITLSPLSITVMSDNIPGGQPQGEWVTPYVLDPNDPATIFAGYQAVYKSTNRGNSWTQLGTPASGGTLNYLEVAPSNSAVLYAGFLNAIFRSSNGGSTWQNITGPLPVSVDHISGFNVDPTDENAVILTMSGYTSGNKVFVTTNGGTTWDNATNSGLPNLPVNCSHIDAVAGVVYLGTDAGVYLFDAGTSSWQSFNSNLPNVVVTDLDIQYNTGMLRAATFGRGVWETPTLSVGFSSARKATDLLVFPNPNKGRFTLQLSSLMARVEGVKLFNSTGQVVWEIQVERTSGNERITIDTGSLPPGMYLLNVLTNRGPATERIVIE